MADKVADLLKIGNFMQKKGQNCLIVPCRVIYLVLVELISAYMHR